MRASCQPCSIKGPPGWPGPSPAGQMQLDSGQACLSEALLAACAASVTVSKVTNARLLWQQPAAVAAAAVFDELLPSCNMALSHCLDQLLCQPRLHTCQSPLFAQLCGQLAFIDSQCGKHNCALRSSMNASMDYVASSCMLSGRGSACLMAAASVEQAQLMMVLWELAVR